MFGTRYLAEAFLNESKDHKLKEETRKELESLGFKELNDGSFMLTPTGKMTEVITVDQKNVKAALIDSGYYEASEFTGLK